MGSGWSCVALLQENALTKKRKVQASQLSYNSELCKGKDLYSFNSGMTVTKRLIVLTHLSFTEGHTNSCVRTPKCILLEEQATANHRKARK